MVEIVAKENLITTRLKKGFTLRGLGKVSKVHYATISNIETKKRAVSPATAKKICDALGEQFEELFEIIKRGG